MGRAIVRNPKVFLFDEPLSNLDAKLRGQMRVEIKNLQRALGVTSVYVTHDQLEAMTLADMLVVMNAGLVEQVGQPLDIYERPASTFVASFIGAPPMNFLAGRVAADGDGVVLPGGDRVAAGAAAPGGRLVTVGIRPEHLQLAAETPAAGALHITADLVEALGADTLVHGRVGADGGALLARLPGNAR